MMSETTSAANKRKREGPQYRRLRTLNSFEMDKVVGTGTFGVVFKAIEKDTTDRVALKKIKMEKETQGFPITAIREIKILKALDHVNIVRLKDIVTYDENADGEEPKEAKLSHGDVFMVFEFCDFDLSGLLRSRNVTLTDKHVKSYTKQLLSGMHYMHTNKILHRDIKGANILVTRGNVLKIADWGLARSCYSEKQKLTNPVVTLWYRSPELLLGTDQYDAAVDVWSVGCLFAEMRSRTHTPLFKGNDEMHQLQLIYQLCGTPSGDLEDKFKSLTHFEKFTFAQRYTNRIQRVFGHVFDKNTLALLIRLIDLDPATRIKANQALDMDYFWVDPPPPPERLPAFTVDAAFSLTEDERIREEHKKAVKAEEERRAAYEEKQRLEREGNMRAGGPGRGRGRMLKSLPQQSKFKIIKPSQGTDAKPTNDASEQEQGMKSSASKSIQEADPYGKSTLQASGFASYGVGAMDARFLESAPSSVATGTGTATGSDGFSSDEGEERL